MVRARKAGKSIRAIATRFGVSVQTIYHITSAKARRAHNTRNRLWARRVKPWRRLRQRVRRKLRAKVARAHRKAVKR